VCEFDENKCSESHYLLKDANLNVFLFYIFFSYELDSFEEQLATKYS
jgi:hypothetical protein